MKISHHTLEKISVLYIYFALLLFIGGWLRGRFALPLILAFAYVYYKKYFKRKEEKDSFLVMDKWTFLLMLAVITLWLTASGIGGFCKQTGDWNKHNAILHDLITYDWPVIYSLPEGERGLLSYYLLAYLFPALVGKIGGFRMAELAMLLQSIAGVVLVYLNLCRFLKTEKKGKQLLLLGMFMSFGGAILLGKAIYGCFLPQDLANTFHWYSKSVRIQYTGNTTLLMWVFPQTIVPWLATILFLEKPDKIEDFVWTGLPVFLYSCFAFVGLLPFYFGMTLYRLIREKKPLLLLKQACSMQNLYALIGILPVFVLYIAGNIFQEKPNSVGFTQIDYSGKWILYLSFCFFNFLIYSLFLWKREKRNPVFYIANAILLILPFFKYGHYNDLCMRSSIPALFVIAVLLYRFVLDLQPGKKYRKFSLIVIMSLLVAAALPQMFELSKKALRFSVEGDYRLDRWQTLTGKLIRNEKNNIVAYNYVAYNCENTFFVKYLAKRR